MAAEGNYGDGKIIKVIEAELIGKFVQLEHQLPVRMVVHDPALYGKDIGEAGKAEA